MKLLPVALNVQGRRCLVVGGGAVAARKAKSLLECEAEVIVISPQLCKQFGEIMPVLEYSARPYRAGDGTGCALIFACTNQPDVNAAVAAEAHALGVWCNRADDSEQSDFHSMAAVRRGDICIGISSSGGSPALTRHLRERIAETIGPEYSTLLEILEKRRAALKTALPNQAQRAIAWRTIMETELPELLRQIAREDIERTGDAPAPAQSDA